MLTMQAKAEVSEQLQLAASHDVLVGRQPIYNDNLGVYAYELLFRSEQQTIHQIGEDAATAQVIVNTLLNTELGNLVGDRHLAINLTEEFLFRAHTLPLTPERVILDIPSSISIHKETLKAIQYLSSMGFTIAVDNIADEEKLKHLLPLSHILRVDIADLDRGTLPKFVKKFRKFKHINLLALRVESFEEYDFYHDHGFKYYQGYLLSRPRVYKTKNLASNKLTIMRLLAILHDARSDTKDIENIVSRDVSLSYKLLKVINSAYFSLPRKVESISQALVLLGRDQIRSWVSMLSLCGMNNRPTSIIELALTRAKLCELLAAKAGLRPTDRFFTVGMFSALDILMEQPLDSLLKSLPLSDTIKTAILKKEGEMGEALRCALAYEQADWSNVRFKSLQRKELLVASLTAINWANYLLSSVAR